MLETEPVEPPDGGLREAKKSATRRALSSAARRLAVEQGLDAVSVEMICRDAQVSVRTFFNYFESKDAAVLGINIPLGTDSAIATFVSGGPTGRLLSDMLVLMDPTEVISRVGREELQLVFQLLGAEPRILALQLARSAGHEDELAVAVAARRGLSAPDPSCRTVAAVAQALVRRASMNWFHDGSDRPLRAFLTLAELELGELSGPASTS